jgi:hypothetical protein
MVEEEGGDRQSWRSLFLSPHLEEGGRERAMEVAVNSHVHRGSNCKNNLLLCAYGERERENETTFSNEKISRGRRGQLLS